MSQQADIHGPSSPGPSLPSTNTTLPHRKAILSRFVADGAIIDDLWGPLGLTLLHEPSKPLIEFIFVHDLGGGSKETWSDTGWPMHCWLKEWLPSEPQFSNVRIHTFGYDSGLREEYASPTTIHDFGQALLTGMRNSPVLGQTDTPIVLVGHCIGGLVIKQMIILAKQDPAASDVASLIRTLFFLATPNAGSPFISAMDILYLATDRARGRNASGRRAATFRMGNLSPYTEAIEMINKQFLRAYQGQYFYSFFANVPLIKELVGMHDTVIDRDSAVLNLPGEKVSPLDTDHEQMCRFDTPDDSNYIRLKDSFIESISLIQRKRIDDINKLARYLGLKERPGDDLANITEHQVAGSCAWLTDKDAFHQWLEDTGDAPKCFWLRGEPASGKSTLAGHVVNYLEAHNKACAYFFFKHIHTGRSTVAELLCSLALQMASTNDGIRQRLVDMCDSGVIIDNEDEHYLWRTLFATRILRATHQKLQILVIDGLDECANPASLFPFLSKIQKQIRLRIFITSRVSLGFERAFARENVANIAEAIPLDATLRDMRIYLNKRSPRFPAESDEKRQQLVQTILDRSNGNFHWTNLVVKILENLESEEKVAALSEVFQVPMLARTVLSSPRRAPLAKGILRWTLCSLRPLTVNELGEALKFDIGESLSELDKAAVPEICGHFVYVDSNSRIHATRRTIRDFFFGRTQEDPEGHEYAMNREAEHARVAKACLSYLNSDDMKPPRFRRANAHAHKREAAERSLFSTYAIVYFADHILHSSTSNREQLETLHQFLMSNSSTWIEAVARTADLTPLTRTANNLKTYVKRRAKYEAPVGIEVRNVLAWATDLVYLVAQFGRMLTASPQAIHHLIPAVCPKESIIFNTFKPHPRGLQVAGPDQDHWNDKTFCIFLPNLQILCAACQDNTFCLGTSKGDIYIYEESTLQEKRQLSHSEPVQRLCFGTLNDFLTSAGRDQLKCWNISTGYLMWSLTIRDEVIALAFSEDDKRLYVAERVKLVTVMDVQTGEELETFNFADWSEDDRHEHKDEQSPIHAEFMVQLGLLGVAYQQRPLHLWDFRKHEPLGQYHRSMVASSTESSINTFIFNPNPDISLAAVSYQDEATYVFDPETQKTQATANTGPNTVLAASPGGNILAIGSDNGFIELYDFETAELLHRISLHQQPTRSIVFNSRGRRLFELQDNCCNVWEPSALLHQHTGDDFSTIVSDGEPLVPQTSIVKMVSEQRSITAIAAHHDNDFVFCGREDGTVAAYAIKTGKTVQELFCDHQNVALDFLEWNESLSFLASADRSGRVLVRKVTPTTPGPFELGEAILDVNPTSVICQILPSPDGKTLLISTADNDTFRSLGSASIIKELEHQPSNSSRRWACHSDGETLLLFEGGEVMCYKWASLEDDAMQSVMSDANDLGLTDMAVTRVFFPSQCRYACLVASSSTTTTTAGFSSYLLPANALNPTTKAPSLTSVPLDTIKELKAIVGTYKSWLVYLQHGGWICTINIDTAAHDRFYLRHFPVPLHWHGVTANPMVVTSRGSVVMAVEDEIAVFHNGLDFEEKVPV